MNVRIVAGVIALLFLLSGCFSSDSGSGGMNDEDRAAAAASASVLSGSLDDPPDEDDDGGDGANSGNSLMGQFARASTRAMEHCDGGGTHETGVDAGQDVGSPYTTDTIDVEWDYYQDCVAGEGTDFESFTDGYGAGGATQDQTVMYSRWASDPNASLDDLGFFTMESSMGNWRFSGEMHTCDACADFHFANEMFVRWEIENEDTLATIGWGRPNDFLVSEGSMNGTGLEQTIDGYMMMSVDGTPCDLEVEYSTVTPLQLENFGTVDETIVSGELNIEIVGSGTFNAEYINGELYIDGNLVDPDQPNPCDISLM